MPARARFMSPRDLIITPSVWSATLLIPLAPVLLAHRRLGADGTTCVAIYVLLLVALTIATARLIRALFPIREGTFRLDGSDTNAFVWSLVSAISIANMGWLFLLTPPPFRKPLLQLLGAKMGRGIISIGGRVSEPYLTEIEETAIIGDDALILAHAISAIPEDRLILKRVIVRRGAIVGARCILMPGVVVGENAMVKAMSLVSMNTVIGPGEVWAGVPARRVEPRPAAPASGALP